MTAPLRAGEPTIVDVALGSRAYDIVIGRGLLAELGARIAALQARRRAPRSSPTRPSRRVISAAARSRARRGRHRASTPIVVPPGEAIEELAHAASTSATGCSTRGSSATTWWSRSAAAWSAISRASRRRSCAAASTSCRCRPRCWRRSIPRSAARPAINSPPRQEPGRRLPPADPGDRRHRAARHAAARASSAPAMPRSRNSA